jgi:alpha,alpha-trehalose-phosphate synthase [UDP-forming]
MKQIYIVILIIILAVSLISVGFTINQVNQEKESLTVDLQYRTSVLADSLKESIALNFFNRSSDYFQTLMEKFSNRENFEGLAIYDIDSKVFAISSNLSKDITGTPDIIAETINKDKASAKYYGLGGKYLFMMSVPVYQNERLSGALLIAQDASFIDDKVADRWQSSILRLFFQDLIIFIVLSLIGRWFVYEPLQKLENSIKVSKSRMDALTTNKKIGPSIFQPLQKEISITIRKLWEARQSASEEARLGLEKLDAPWTEERLKEFVKKYLVNRQIVMVSNREPYIHIKEGKKTNYFIPASGMVTAIDPIMQACGGIWIAHGSGNADKLVVNKKDELLVPPDEMKYTLKRIWLTEHEIKGYYLGFSNEGMWPLFHLAHTRPIFRKQDWDEYLKVNEKFAVSVLNAIRHTEKPLLLIQDFHLALLPRLVKNKRPDANIGIFWHIPWVSAESFSICPWKKEILEGILGADLIGFHTQQYCNNFVDTVGKELESLIDYSQFAVTRNDHRSLIKSFPISIAFTNGIQENEPIKFPDDERNIIKKMDLSYKYLGVGVDRMDYTKGIMERLKGIDIFLRRYPSYQDEFVFVQIAAPSRSEVEKYREFAAQVKNEVERINSELGNQTWKPIVLLYEQHSHEEINILFQQSNFCLVTSLHDGMNLVAKEFIAARRDAKGVLILSQFAGASKELKDALIINPYDGEQTAEAIHKALTMSLAEQNQRMAKMREVVKNYNIFRWSAEFLKTLVSLS